ncbi:MAG: EAL domain-containing protein, partial [Gallionella sp.]|nr:EAL domain-containing protein [Gallionella sp.]
DGSGVILHQHMMIQSALWYPFAFRENGYFLLTLNHIYADKEWQKEEIDFLDSVSQLVTVALEKIRLLEESQSLAFYDSLTRLPNRWLLTDRLKHGFGSVARSGKRMAVLFIDLDNFKTINDTLGHNVGDMLLQQVAQRLLSCVREVDTVARLGGDEFVVVLEELSEQELEAAEQAEHVGEKILVALRQPIHLASDVLRTSASIGAALLGKQNSEIDVLFKQADIAMYQAKKAGRNTLRFFDPQMQETISARVALENEMRIAIQHDQFRLYYQIQLDSAHRPLGVEGLIRWIHPERGVLLPEQFIAVSEESGQIIPIGQWVIETACAQLKKWESMSTTRDLVLAVNVSAKQFRQPGFVAQVQAAVSRHAIAPKRLKLELTESLLLDNIEDTIVSLNALRAIGIQLSLDDFGTGYSSLQYIRRLPLDQIKIDQSFVSGLGGDESSNAIIRTIIAMAQSFHLDVIAEGVETEQQLQLLTQNGCRTFQGYLFGKPMPVEQFEEWLRQN